MEAHSFFFLSSAASTDKSIRGFFFFFASLFTVAVINQSEKIITGLHLSRFYGTTQCLGLTHPSPLFCNKRVIKMEISACGGRSSEKGQEQVCIQQRCTLKSAQLNYSRQSYSLKNFIRAVYFL